MKSGGFHTDFIRISWNRRISYGFYHEIQWISWNLWNPADFTQISPVKSKNYKRKCFSKNSSVWWMQGGGYDQGFHEIHQISPWNLVDFTHEIWQISPVKSTQIIKASVSAKTLQFDECRVGDFTLEIQWISPWNLVDFTHEIWQISPVKSTQNYKSKCFSKNSSVWRMQGGGFHPWNPVDFTHEIWQISPRFDLWNPPKIIKASVLAKTLQFDECRVGDFTLEIQWISPWNLVDLTCEIWWISPRFDLWNPP